MAGIGSEAVGGLAALQASLRQRLADQIAQQERERLAQQQTFQNDLATRRMAMDEDTHRATQARLLQQERDTAAAKVPLSIGDTIEQPTYDRTFKDTATASLFTPQMTLPATQYGGGSTAPMLRGRLRRSENGGGSQDEGGADMAASGTGYLRTAAPRVATGRLTYSGTPAQRSDADQKAVAARLIASFPEGSRERRALEYEQATGKSAPAGMFEPRPVKEPTPHYQFLPTYDESGNPSGVVAGNTLTGDISTRTVPGGAQLRPPKVVDNPKIPRGVQDYLLQLRHTYGGDLQAAENELAGTWETIRAAHPHAEAATVVGALRSMFGAAAGSSPLVGLGLSPSAIGIGGSVAAPGGGRGGPPPQRTGGPPAGGGQTMTRAELQAVADRLGISAAEAETQARARGITVQ